MSTPQLESSFDEKGGVLQQMRGRRNHERTSGRARVGDHVQWHAMVEEAAYYCAERRGFQPGHELDDWLQAEAEISRTRI